MSCNKIELIARLPPRCIELTAEIDPRAIELVAALPELIRLTACVRDVQPIGAYLELQHSMLFIFGSEDIDNEIYANVDWQIINN